jgi:hypothetical protein
LGRNLAGGAKTATVNLFAPNTLFGPRINQLDVRLSKIAKLGRYRFQGNLDVYNVLNGSAPLQVNTTYGPSWLTPQDVLNARLVKFGFQFGF